MKAIPLISANRVAGAANALDRLGVAVDRLLETARLRELKQADVTAALGVVSQLERNDAGIYVNVPPGENLDPGRGVRMEGKQLQFGLTDDEIEDVWERIEDLIEDVDDGDLPVF